MISDAEYSELDGVAQAELVQRGEVSASELLEAAIRRADAVNPRLNAIVISMHEIGRARAGEALAGPFAGVPFLLKDLFQDYAGVLATSGSRSRRNANAIPDRHSRIVERWLAAGFVIFGRTNTAEFGAKGITEPDAWGPTRNPWNLELSPGGSSGGAAAAVAAGIVPIAGASDGGGSIRVPASWTGLFGLKPGRGRTPHGPHVSETLHGAAVNHVLTRSVRDSAWALDTTHGPELGAPYRIEPPARPYREMVERDPGRLRIAFSTESPIGLPVDPHVVAAVERTAHMLASLGHDVEPAAPRIDGVRLARDFAHVWFAHLAHEMQATRDGWNVQDLEFELDSLSMEAIAKSRSGVEYVQSYIRWGEYGVRLAEFLSGYDLYLTPTVAEPPPRVGSIKTPEWAVKLTRAGTRYGLLRLTPLFKQTIDEVTIANLKPVPFTQLANVTGVPAMSVPLQTFPNGLPLGVQFLAAHGGEGVLLSLAGQLERSAPWSGRRPALE